MTISSARALDEHLLELRDVLDGNSESGLPNGPIAANAPSASPEDVERIRRLIEETSRTVAKFRKLVVANAEGGGEATMEMLGEYRAAAEVVHDTHAPDRSAQAATAPRTEPSARPGVLWSAAMKTEPNGNGDKHRLPRAGRAELQARRRDEKDGKPETPPLGSGQSAYHEDDETLPDFFTLRRSLRYLQFRNQMGAGYGEEIKNEYTLLLEALAEAAVQYDAMHRSTRHHREATEQLEKMRAERERERRNAQEQARNVERLQAELERSDEAGKTLKDQLASLREEHEAKAKTLGEQKKAFELEKKERAETMSLLVAETSILRNALSDACDTIAEDMTRRLSMESQVQDLEDRLAARSPGAQKLERYAE